jgi:hypothetical protein
MVLPILIYVSDAPASYFFCASAEPLIATEAKSAATNAALPVVSGERIFPPGLGAEDQLFRS